MSSLPREVAEALGTAFIGWDGEAATRALRVPELHISAKGNMDNVRTLQALNPPRSGALRQLEPATSTTYSQLTK
jgi:hypothetical protein